mmetsp:Transcript_15819/g.28961  ORF Transcript_15819/g.28961 Transcript_15819/m.28961 type:complete len:237 (-) Transcript_15819:646-1356(-)
MALILSSRRFFCSFSIKNSLDLNSRASMAASLSASACRFSFSSSENLCRSRLLLPWLSSSAFKRAISRSYFLMRVLSSSSSLIVGAFLICLALFANFKVLKVSDIESEAGEIIAIIVVLQFPPRESSSNLVSLESRYGMCVLGLESVKATMTFPRADKDWLIFLDSCSLWPVAPETLSRSDPAKSTKLSLPILACLPFLVLTCSSTIMNTAWLRLETSLSLVEAVVRASWPWVIRS